MSLLEARGLSVRFGGHVAVSDVDLDVDASRVTGLIGPNGAGKTTMFNALCGLQSLSAGTVSLDGKDITRLATYKRARRGLARTFQRLELFGSLTVRENLEVAAENRVTTSGAAPPARAVSEAIDFVGLGAITETRADSLPTGQARLVELGRALVTRPRVVLLDEPASGLNGPETDAFVELVHSLADSGMAILLVEHDMSVVMAACSLINVLEFGRIIAAGSPEEIQTDEAVLNAYLGSTETAS